jgi:hypothetical protein
MEKASIKGIQNLFSNPISNATASRIMTYTRDVLNKPKPKIITLEDIKTVNGLAN